MYLGSWRLESHLMMIISKAFLIIAMRYRTQNGIPIPAVAGTSAAPEREWLAPELGSSSPASGGQGW